MTHDPLCPSAAHSDDCASCNAFGCLNCELIAIARNDERRAAANRLEEIPFLDGGRTINRRKAILAVKMVKP